MIIPSNIPLKGRRVQLKRGCCSIVWASVLEETGQFIKVQQTRSIATYWANRKDILQVDPPFHP